MHVSRLFTLRLVRHVFTVLMLPVALVAQAPSGTVAGRVTANGIPSVTMGCGQVNVHTTGERLDIADFHAACQIALRLATTVEG